MKLQGLIVGRGLNSIVTDGRVLRSMDKREHIQYPVDKGHPYVDHRDLPRDFTYKNNRYRITYFDGCFFPFVVKMIW